PSLHALAAGGGPAHRRPPRRARFRARRRAAEPARRAQRLPVPHAVPAGAGPVRDRGTTAPADRGPLGGLPLRLMVMHGPAELVLGLLIAVAALVTIARHVEIAYPIFLVIGGLILGLVPGVPRIHIDPEMIFL